MVPRNSCFARRVFFFHFSFFIFHFLFSIFEKFSFENRLKRGGEGVFYLITRVIALFCHFGRLCLPVFTVVGRSGLAKAFASRELHLFMSAHF